jgi:hypothetical protein
MMAKILKITNAAHQSSRLAEKFKTTFGLTIPKPVITRWNTHFQCVKRVSQFDRNQLNDILSECDYDSLFLTVTDYEKINDFVKIMQRFNQASELSQGDQYPTISLVAPTVVSLYRHLVLNDSTCTHFKSFIKKLSSSLVNRFAGIFNFLGLVDYTIENKFVSYF